MSDDRLTSRAGLHAVLSVTRKRWVTETNYPSSISCLTSLDGDSLGWVCTRATRNCGKDVYILCRL